MGSLGQAHGQGHTWYGGQVGEHFVDDLLEIAGVAVRTRGLARGDYSAALETIWQATYTIDG